MKRDEIVGGEAMSAVEGHDVTYMLGSARVFDMQEEPQRRAFNAYRVAFKANAEDPNLKHGAALVRAWNDFADIMGLDRV